MLWIPMLQELCLACDGSWHLTEVEPPHWEFSTLFTLPAEHDLVYEQVWPEPS